MSRKPNAGLAAVAVLLAGGVVVAGMDGGHPARDVRMGSGAAWLPSAKVGQVTLLDGNSAEVAAQVQVAPAGDVLEVVQQGAAAYVVNQTAGTVRRVDGATFDLGEPRSPIPDAGAGLTAIPGRTSLYTLDRQRGVLADTDPVTLTRRGELLPLASELSAGTAAVDEAGTLWAIDTATGDLTRVAGRSRSVSRRIAEPGKAILTVSNGHPVVVDTVSRTVIDIDRDTGEARGRIDLDLRTGDTVEVSGSARAERVYVVVGRGVLVVCDLATGCDTAIALNPAGRFGAAVEAGDRVFVPDHTTGQVWIVDPVRPRVIAKPAVLSPAGPFQLLTRDGVVFYNDTNTERAGVVRLDGTVVPVVKYDPDNPKKGLTTPDREPAGSDGPPGNPDGPPGNPDEPPTDTGEPPRDPGEPPTDPGEPPSDPGRPPSDPGEPGGPGDPGGPGNPPADPGDPPTGPGNPPGNPNEPPEPRLEIAMTEVNPTVDQEVTLRVNNTSGDAPVAASWTFGDGGQGDGVVTTHAWTEPRNSYLITVIATLPDGRQATTSNTITVTEKPAATLSVSVPGGGGRVFGGGIDCPGVCSISVEPGTVITLDDDADADHEGGTWGGACAGATFRCDLTMDTDKAVTFTFTARKLALAVFTPDGGTVTGDGGINCPGTCSARFDKGTTVRLTATPDANHTFRNWAGCDTVQGLTCSVTLNENPGNECQCHIVGAVFDPKPASFAAGPAVQPRAGLIRSRGRRNASPPGTAALVRRIWSSSAGLRARV